MKIEVISRRNRDDVTRVKSYEMNGRLCDFCRTEGVVNRGDDVKKGLVLPVTLHTISSQSFAGRYPRRYAIAKSTPEIAAINVSLGVFGQPQSLHR
jgi:hypothetical protein